jgi:hypothetical protein
MTRLVVVPQEAQAIGSSALSDTSPTRAPRKDLRQQVLHTLHSADRILRIVGRKDGAHLAPRVALALADLDRAMTIRDRTREPEVLRRADVETRRADLRAPHAPLQRREPQAAPSAPASHADRADLSRRALRRRLPRAAQSGPQPRGASPPRDKIIRDDDGEVAHKSSAKTRRTIVIPLMSINSPIFPSRSNRSIPAMTSAMASGDEGRRRIVFLTRSSPSRRNLWCGDITRNDFF